MGKLGICLFIKGPVGKRVYYGKIHKWNSIIRTSNGRDSAQKDLIFGKYPLENLSRNVKINTRSYFFLFLGVFDWNYTKFKTVEHQGGKTKEFNLTYIHQRPK